MHSGKSSVSVFEEIVSSTNKIFISGRRLSTRQQFYLVLKISWYFLIFQVLRHSATRLYWFITNNHVLLQLWWKKTLLNHQKALKHYEHDCSLLIYFIVSAPRFMNNIWKIKYIFKIFWRCHKQVLMTFFSYSIVIIMELYNSETHKPKATHYSKKFC